MIDTTNGMKKKIYIYPKRTGTSIRNLPLIGQKLGLIGSRAICDPKSQTKPDLEQVRNSAQVAMVTQPGKE